MTTLPRSLRTNPLHRTGTMVALATSALLLTTSAPSLASAASERNECADKRGVARQICMGKLRRQVRRARRDEREEALRAEAAGGPRASRFSDASERMAQGIVTELTKRKKEIANAGGFVTAEIASSIINNDDIQAGVLELAQGLSASLRSDMVELTEDMGPVVREQTVLAVKDVLNVMLQEDTISDAASAATNFSLRLVQNLGPRLSEALAESLENDLGPAMAKVVKEDLGPALNDILSDELFPALFSELNKALLSSSEEIARRASRGAVVGVIEGFDDAEVLERFEGVVGELRRETLKDLTDTYDVVLTNSVTQIEGSVGKTLDKTLEGVENGVKSTSKTLTWLFGALMGLGMVGAALLLLLVRRSATKFREELSGLRQAEEEARRHTALAIEKAKEEREVATAEARQTEKALELVTEAIKAREDLEGIQGLVESIKKLEHARPEEGGRALGSFFAERRHLRVAK